MPCLKPLGTLLVFLLLAAPRARADEFHYKNILIGERAAGMGGAFVALSDDPSGAYHNPAGLMRAREGHFSASANALHSTTQTWRNIVPSQDYRIKSSGLVASLFGFTRVWQDRRIAFVIAIPDSDLLDQSDEISNPAAAPGKAAEFRRRTSRQNNLIVVGPAYATSLSESVTFGVSLLGFIRIDRLVDTQLVLFDPIPTGKYVIQDSYLARNTYGLQPKLGVQYQVTPSWRVGATIAYGFQMLTTGTMRQIVKKPDTTGSFSGDVIENKFDVLVPTEPQNLRLAIGNAYQLSSTLLVVADLEYYSGNPSFPGFALRDTFNWALGLEWWATGSQSIRAGLYSNNANTAPVDPSLKNQAPHVSLVGLTFGMSTVSERTSFTLGGSYALGSGDGQVIGDTAASQALHQSSLTVFLSGSYQL